MLMIIIFSRAYFHSSVFLDQLQVTENCFDGLNNQEGYDLTEEKVQK